MLKQGLKKEEAEAIGLNSESFSFTAIPPIPSDHELDEKLAKASDEELNRFAKLILQAQELPEERLANVYKDLVAMRLIHQEQLKWCKHIELVQQLAHTRSRATYYAIDPDRHCRCARFNFESKVGTQEASGLIKTFKLNYCDGCSGRELAEPDVSPVN